MVLRWTRVGVWGFYYLELRSLFGHAVLGLVKNLPPKRITIWLPKLTRALFMLHIGP